MSSFVSITVDNSANRDDIQMIEQEVITRSNGVGTPLQWTCSRTITIPTNAIGRPQTFSINAATTNVVFLATSQTAQESFKDGKTRSNRRSIWPETESGKWKLETDSRGFRGGTAFAPPRF